MMVNPFPDTNVAAPIWNLLKSQARSFWRCLEQGSVMKSAAYPFESLTVPWVPFSGRKQNTDDIEWTKAMQSSTVPASCHRRWHLNDEEKMTKMMTTMISWSYLATSLHSTCIWNLSLWLVLPAAVVVGRRWRLPLPLPRLWGTPPPSRSLCPWRAEQEQHYSSVLLQS